MTPLEQEFMDTFHQYWKKPNEKWRLKSMAAYGKVVRARNKAQRILEDDSERVIAE